jgi:hypothetical protein
MFAGPGGQPAFRSRVAQSAEAAAAVVRARGTRRNDAYSALAQVSARARRTGDSDRCSLRIPDGRLPAAAAIVLVVYAFLALERRLVRQQRLFGRKLGRRAQLAEHAERRRLFRRWRRFDAESWWLAIFFAWQ